MRFKHHSLIWSVLFCVISGVTLFCGIPPVRSESLPIIPQPAEETVNDGFFRLTADTPIYFLGDLETEARLLAAEIKQSTHLSLPIAAMKDGATPLNSKPSLQLILSDDAPNEEEGYRLTVTPEQIMVTGNDAAGVYWGAQSLLQLITPGDNPQLPACQIIDQPRFAWRGIMLDVGRYMFDVEDIKQLIDWMALHKLNKLHWHLTDDQGWRIEIKKYPKLTEVGAWRESSPPYGDRRGSDETRYGGFYSQEEIKDLVRYATERHITIIPEIDMPGHMTAAIASYPKLGNDDIPNYDPQVASSWGVQPYILSPKEGTFQWLDDVFAEVCDLFPSKYIHIGGDEAPKGQWKESAFVQSVIKREGLKNEHELQSWFIRRVEAMLNAKGRKLIGWDEIREGGLSPDATVMAWQTWESAVDSAREGHDVIMAPKSHTYFDYYQSDPKSEIAKGLEYEAIGGYLPLAKVYEFDPMPAELVGTEFAHHILGCQGQIWTEHIKTWNKAEYLTFPRFSALAEAAWSSLERKNYHDFLQRLSPMLARYKAAGIRYFDPLEEFSVNPRWDALIETSLPSYAQSTPAFVFDGDHQTYFVAARSLDLSDYFTVTFKSPIRSAPIRVFTGSSMFGSREKKWGGKEDALENGVLEASTDGTEWQEVAKFENGRAHGILPDRCQSIRIRATEKQPATRLVISEIQIDKKWQIP